MKKKATPDKKDKKPVKRPPAKKAAPKKKAKPKPPPKPRALITVFNKDGIVEQAAGLVDAGFEIISTGGTFKTLIDGGVPCIPVTRITNFPECFDGRVKTINPMILGPILAMTTKEHEVQMYKLKMQRISVVFVDLYPFVETLTKEGVTHADIIEKIDIGGILLIRAAAKNADCGIVIVCDPADRGRVIAEIKKHGEVSPELRQELQSKAFRVSALYDAAIHAYLEQRRTGNIVTFEMHEQIRECRKAENDDQGPAIMMKKVGYDLDSDPLAWPNWTVVNGNPGYINWADGDETLKVICRLAEAFRRNFPGRKVPFITIACKHGNPCGVGVSWKNRSDSIVRAMFGDPTAVMGAEVMTNFHITGQEAAVIHVVPKDAWQKVGRKYWGPDVVFAPSFNSAAESLLSAREPQRHLVANPALEDPQMAPEEFVSRPIRGGKLRQKTPTFVFDKKKVATWVNAREFSDDELATLLIAWVVGWCGVSNSVVLAKDLMLIGTGLGQQDRRGAFKLAVIRAQDAGNDPTESFGASDGFLPFAENIDGKGLPEAAEQLVAIGCRGIVVPADGNRLQEVKAYLEQHGITAAMVDRIHRGFAKH